MSLLSVFIAEHVVKSLEQEFLKHAPELQAKLLEEVSQFSGQVLSWVATKLPKSGKPE
jgi:hypothetical protein